MFVEVPEVLATLRMRLRDHPKRPRVSFVEGDCNLVIDEILRQLPTDHLTLAFIDPTGLQIRFETIRRLMHNRKVDLLMIIQFGMGILMNLHQYIKSEGGAHGHCGVALFDPDQGHIRPIPARSAMSAIGMRRRRRAALIGGVLGVFGFVHVISMDAWVSNYPVSCTVAGVIVAFMLSVAMFGTRRDDPRAFGNFEILAGAASSGMQSRSPFTRDRRRKRKPLRTPRMS